LEAHQIEKADTVVTEEENVTSRILTRFAAMTLFAALAIPPRPAAQVAGSGTTNFIPKWTGNTSLGNSAIFQSGGQIGIGTTTPAARLHVIGLKGTDGTAGTAPTSAPKVLNSTGGAGGNLPLGQFGTAGGGGGLQLTSGNGGSTGSLSTSGHALGGTGAAILMTGGTGGGHPGSFFRGGNGGSIMLQPGVAGSSSQAVGQPGNVILAATAGSVGIKTMNPLATLDVGAGGTTLADAWTTRSSRRFKTNIQVLEDPLEKVEQLQGVSYDRKTDGKHEIGVVAEDVERVVPELVSRDPETGEVQGVDYSRLSALLIEAVKSQQAEIQLLKAQIEQLTSNAPRQ
jgi:hypothetical protein